MFQPTKQSALDLHGMPHINDTVLHCRKPMCTSIPLSVRGKRRCTMSPCHALVGRVSSIECRVFVLTYHLHIIMRHVMPVWSPFESPSRGVDDIRTAVVPFLPALPLELPLLDVGSVNIPAQCFFKLASSLRRAWPHSSMPSQPSHLHALQRFPWLSAVPTFPPG